MAASRGRPRRAGRRSQSLCPRSRRRCRAIGALGAPQGDEREVEAIIAATERGIDQVRADPADVVNGPPPALRRAGRLARAYGSEECAVR